MSAETPSGNALQFDRAEFAEGVSAGAACSSCSNPIVQSYYEIGGRILCSDCRENREQAHAGVGLTRAMRALGAGIGAAILGSVLWYAVRALTGYEVGLISIAVGIGVGKAVAWGAHGKGGWFYQSIALVLTYTSIVTNYIPDLVEYMAATNPGVPVVILYISAFIASFPTPFYGGFENLFGILIIAFGLWEAWKINKRTDALVTGPFSVAPAATPPIPAPNV